MDYYYVSSLKWQSAGRHAAPLGHVNLIPSQPAFFFNAGYGDDKEQISVL